MISIDQLNIHKKYGGLEDGLSIVGKPSEKQMFNNNDWGTITSYQQSIELIAKGLTSDEFKSRTIQELQKNLDSIAFIEITKPISSIVLEMNGYSSEQQKHVGE